MKQKGDDPGAEPDRLVIRPSDPTTPSPPPAPLPYPLSAARSSAARGDDSSPAEWDADTYHRIADPQTVWGRRVLARLQLRGDETVLDAGCGTGRLTAELLDRLPRGRVIAVDRSGEMLRAATKYLAPRYGDRVSFLRSNLEDLMLPRQVDAIFSTATFHWVVDHPRLFGRLYTFLRPGGRLIAQCGGGPNLERLLRRVDALTARPEFAEYFVEWEGPWEFADDETTAERMRRAGFDDIWTSLEEAPTILPDAAAYRTFVESVILRAHLARLATDVQRNAFLDDLTDQAAVDDPPYSLDYWRLNLAGQRPAQPGKGHR